MARAKPPAGPGIPPLEWAAAAVGLVLVCGALGTMVLLAISRDGTPPDIALRVESVSATRAGHVVAISAVNRGGTTAAEVVVEGELRGASGVAETSSMTFSYLAPDSRRQGGLFFEKDPRGYEIRLRARGYEAP